MSNPDSIPMKLVAPPPILYIGTLLLAVTMHVLMPITLFPATLACEFLAGLVLACSGAFARWAFLTMRRSGTTANPRQPSAALVTEGPFRLSRNPIYVAMTGLYLGLAFLVNSGWPFILLVPLLVAMQWGVILREERYLTEIFGSEYTAYKSRVRRWL